MAMKTRLPNGRSAASQDARLTLLLARSTKAPPKVYRADSRISSKSISLAALHAMHRAANTRDPEAIAGARLLDRYSKKRGAQARVQKRAEKTANARSKANRVARAVINKSGYMMPSKGSDRVLDTADRAMVKATRATSVGDLRGMKTQMSRAVTLTKAARLMGRYQRLRERSAMTGGVGGQRVRGA